MISHSNSPCWLYKCIWGPTTTIFSSHLAGLLPKLLRALWMKKRGHRGAKFRGSLKLVEPGWLWSFQALGFLLMNQAFIRMRPLKSPKVGFLHLFPSTHRACFRTNNFSALAEWESQDPTRAMPRPLWDQFNYSLRLKWRTRTIYNLSSCHCWQLIWHGISREVFYRVHSSFLCTTFSFFKPNL